MDRLDAALWSSVGGRRQLRAPHIELALLNGPKVVQRVHELGIVTLEDRGATRLGKKGKTSRLLEGTASDGTRFLGWTLNTSHSQTTPANRAQLASWVAERTQ